VGAVRARVHLLADLARWHGRASWLADVALPGVWPPWEALLPRGRAVSRVLLDLERGGLMAKGKPLAQELYRLARQGDRRRVVHGPGRQGGREGGLEVTLLPNRETVYVGR
jgi:hypothetical protein